MSHAQSWDSLYADGQHLSQWPWSQLVSLCMRHSALKLKSSDFKVLEVGCGAGANIPFFLHYTNKVYAQDFSQIIVKQLKERFPAIEDNISVSDFTQSFNGLTELDLIADRGASVNNTLLGIQSYLSIAHNALKEGGLLIITDWMSTESSFYKHGVEIEDGLTKTDFDVGPFVGVGPIRFFNREAIKSVIEPFELVYLEHMTTEVDGSDETSACWNLVLKKRS